MLKKVKVDQKMVPYRKTGLHTYGHTHSITVPKNQFIDSNAKYVPYISTDGNYILYKKVQTKPNDPFDDPNVNYQNLKKFMHGNHLPADFQDRPVGKENIYGTQTR